MWTRLSRHVRDSTGRMRGFFGELGSRAKDIDLFFMAGAITFNVLVAVVPLVLLTAGIAGFFVTTRFGQVEPEIVEVLLGYLPPTGEIGVRDLVDRFMEGLVEGRTGLSVVGGVILAWISTRLVATLRIVLRDVFELERDRGVIMGKLFDFQVVIVTGLLVILNLAVTIAIRAVESLGTLVLGSEGAAVEVLQLVVGRGLALGSAWVLFFLLYRFIPARGIKFRTAVIGATIAAIGFELLKAGFAWYVTSVADYSSMYGSVGVGVVLFFWIYYSAVLFIMAGLIARTLEVRRSRNMENEKDKADRQSPAAGGAAILVLIAATLLGPPALQAQSSAPFGGNGSSTGLLAASDGVIWGERSLERELILDRPLVEHDGPYNVVHLAENRVFVVDGTEIQWSAPAGTGHGIELEGQGQEWTFTTPEGMFKVLRKERDPVWIAPDWYFVQRGIPIPGRRDPARFIDSTLGTSALFLGEGIAIHGTDDPQLLLDPDPEARRVSHGCIRLTNEAARQLFHQVEVGTPVLVY